MTTTTKVGCIYLWLILYEMTFLWPCIIWHDITVITGKTQVIRLRHDTLPHCMYVTNLLKLEYRICACHQNLIVCISQGLHYTIWKHPVSLILFGCPGSLLPIKPLSVHIYKPSWCCSKSMTGLESLSLSIRYTHFHMICKGTDSSAETILSSKSASFEDAE